MSTVSNKAVLITGANRGLGHAFVEEALARGARLVYAGSRQPMTHPDERVTPLTFDVTDEAQIQSAVGQVESLDILINNAGISGPDDLGDRAAFERHLAVNLFGAWAVTNALLPTLERPGGAVVNVVSLAALAAVPVLPAYSVSKAALFALTQSQRALLARDGVSVHAVLGGPIDTDMVRDLPVPKTPPRTVAGRVFEEVAAGHEDLFPDPYAELFAEGWIASSAKDLERQNAQLVQAQPGDD